MEELIKKYEEYAKEQGFRLNPDRRVVEGTVKGLLANEKKYGKRYCPCRRIVGEESKDRGKVCPCQWHLDEIEKDGSCLCKLFFK